MSGLIFTILFVVKSWRSAIANLDHSKLMTDAQRAAIKPGDVVLVRAVVSQGALNLFDAGDHLRVRVEGGATFWSPTKEIFLEGLPRHGLPLS